MSKVFDLGHSCVRSKEGMEMVQVAILVAIAVALGLLFKDRIVDFVNSTFNTLDDQPFTTKPSY